MLMHFHHVSDGNVLFPVNFYFSGWALFWAKFSQIKSSWSKTIQSKHFHNILLWGHQHQHLLYLIIVSMTMASSHFQTLFIVPIFFFFPKYIIYKYKKNTMDRNEYKFSALLPTAAVFEYSYFSWIDSKLIGGHDISLTIWFELTFYVIFYCSKWFAAQTILLSFIFQWIVRNKTLKVVAIRPSYLNFKHNADNNYLNIG